MSKAKSTRAISLSFQQLIDTICSTPPQQSILIRGPTGLGKSALAFEVGRQLNLPVIDVRASTQQEGDITGYPDAQSAEQFKVSTFYQPSFFVRACREPVILFLDELNRALPPVLQGYFQLVLDYALGNDVNGMPVKLHPQTRIISAINAGADYDVAEFDPALVRRFMTFDMTFDMSEWIKWGRRNGFPEVLIDFLVSKDNLVVEAPDPENPFATPAGWHKFVQALQYKGTDLDKLRGQALPDVHFRQLAGLCGINKAALLSDHLKAAGAGVTPEMVLNGWDSSLLRKLESKVFPNTVLTANFMDSLIYYIHRHLIPDANGNIKGLSPMQAQNHAKFWTDCAPHLRGDVGIAAWKALKDPISPDQIKGKLHPWLEIEYPRISKALESTLKQGAATYVEVSKTFDK